MSEETLKIDTSKTDKFINQKSLENIGNKVNLAHDWLHNKTGLGNDFLGWVDLPQNYNKEEFNRIKETANKIQNDSDALVVIGIGGSYLGARAAIEALAKKSKVKIYYAGNNLSSTYINDLFEELEGKDVSLNVISKSGTTTEPALAFRIFKEWMEKKYGIKDANKRIYTTTDEKRGVLKKMSTEMGYESFTIPDDIGGRYSVLTAVGLLPIAVAGINIDEMMQGATDARMIYQEKNWKNNSCYTYAVYRNALYNEGKLIEILASYEPRLQFTSEWRKQLYGESEGKNGQGIFPASVIYTTDLHSMGQYVQDGLRKIFETVLEIGKSETDILIKEDPQNLDELNFLAGKTLDYVNKKAMEATILAHYDGNVPNIKITLSKLDAYNFGHLIYFFEKACGISAYLLGVNPFDQPGVEAYKKNMFALLEKPGFVSNQIFR